jgi:chromosome segregation ATPase
VNTDHAELVKRLRDVVPNESTPVGEMWNLIEEAADEIELLTRERERLTRERERLTRERDRLALRVELLESRLADAARLLKDAAPPSAGMTGAEAALIWEWSAARRKFVDGVTGPACARS